MNALNECLESLIAIIEAESDALARQDHLATASLLETKAALSSALQRHVTTARAEKSALTAAHMTKLIEVIGTNRALLERSIRVRGHMLSLLRQAARRTVTSAIYSNAGRNLPSAEIGAATFATRA